MPKVSVIIPVYNVEEYLVECLESVINQTEKDIEIICVEDCSTDSSLEILQEYAKKDKRIVVLQNEVNSGLSVTRNNGLAIAKGEYILFVDSDDFIAPNLLEKTLKNSGDVDMVYFDYKACSSNSSMFGDHNYILPTGRFKALDYNLKLASYNMINFSACSKLYKTSFLKNNHIKFDAGILYEDVLFGFRCMINANNIYSLSDKLYFYRIRSNSIMTSKIKEKNIKDHFFSLYKLSEIYLSGDYSNEMCLVIEKFIQRLERDYVRLYRKYFYQNPKESQLISQDGKKPTKLQRVFSNAFMGITDYTLLLNKHLSEMPDIDKIIVYGAGDIARDVISYFDLNDVAITGVAVSDASKNR